MGARAKIEVGPVEVVMGVMALVTIIMGAWMLSEVFSPGAGERRRAGRIRDLEEELDKLKGEAK